MIRAIFLCVVFLLTACSSSGNIGHPPKLTDPRGTAEFEAMINPPLDITVDSGRPEASASLWRAGQSSLINDSRAAARGDILTVVIEIDDSAEISNSSNRSRDASDNVKIPQFGGIPQRISKNRPELDFDNLVDADSSSDYKGSGKISRRDKLTLRVAATVVDRLPNGTLHIEGMQEVRVNFELRELHVSGFVRPADIDRNNEIEYDRIAGARISYGGRGQITDVQQPRYGQQIADILLPY